MAKHDTHDNDVDRFRRILGLMDQLEEELSETQEWNSPINPMIPIQAPPISGNGGNVSRLKIMVTMLRGTVAEAIKNSLYDEFISGVR